MASKITAYSREGADAARVAREEGDAHRPERCPTCGCEIANRKEDQ